MVYPVEKSRDAFCCLSENWGYWPGWGSKTEWNIRNKSGLMIKYTMATCLLRRLLGKLVCLWTKLREFEKAMDLNQTKLFFSFFFSLSKIFKLAGEAKPNNASATSSKTFILEGDN